MRMVERGVIAAAVLLAAGGCGGGSARFEVPEGATSPEQAVEVFLSAAQEAQQARAAGEFARADRAYERMAAVFGTEKGSMRRSHPAGEVRDRMIVLSACLRPTTFRVIAQSDSQARGAGRTPVTVDLMRGSQGVNLPFSVVLGRGQRWYIEQIDFSSFSC